MEERCHTLIVCNCLLVIYMRRISVYIFLNVNHLTVQSDPGIFDCNGETIVVIFRATRQYRISMLSILTVTSKLSGNDGKSLNMVFEILENLENSQTFQEFMKRVLKLF